MSAIEEIQQNELEHHAASLNEAVETVCAGSAFRTSPRSREFLRYIVRHTLANDTAQLKERLIGMALLGREAAYDTGTDAGVRVRANDVRKRLAAHYKVLDADQQFLIELPTGTYVPRFFRAILDSKPLAQVEVIAEPVPILESVPPLSLQWLVTPTLVAFFLCTVCLRWQVAEEHPFTNFWQKIFQNHPVTLYLSPSAKSNGEELVAMRELKAADPLFDLAGQFHTRLHLTSSLATGAGDSVVVSIGPVPDHANGNRLTIKDTPDGRKIFDRGTPISGSAALLTISNGAQRSIRIDGTDPDAIESLVKMLCERDTFPTTVADSLQDKAVTQIVLSRSPNTQAMTFREPLPLTPQEGAELR